MGLPTARAVPGEVLVLRHVDWEGPHRIADALPPNATRLVDVLRGAPLPDPAGVAGAVVMGGPMGVGDTARHPDLDRERRWLGRAIEHDVPLLGVCLGSQLIASVLGAAVRPGRAEIGFEPVTVTSPGDPLVGGLGPSAVVLHWHRDEFDLPPGAERLAHSERTECQAFRHASAWGLLFHAEADARLLEEWLAVAEMRDDAERELGPDAATMLRAGAVRHERDLTGRSTPGFEAFARMIEDRRRALAGAGTHWWRGTKR